MIHILPYTRAKESSRSPGIHGRWSLDLIQACRPAAPSIGAQGVFLTFPRTVRCTRIFENSPAAEINFCFRWHVLNYYMSSHRGGGAPVRTSDSYLEHPRVVLHWTNLDSKFPQIHKYIEKNRTNHNALLKREEIRMEYDLNILMQMVNLNGNTVVSIPKPRVLGLYKMGLVNPSHLGWSSKQEIQESSKRGVRISKRVAA